MPYERENITRLSAYVPGEQPADARLVKLNTNENPYPPPEPVMQAIRGLAPDVLRRYPSPTAQPFRELAAEVHGVTPAQVIATNGGDELLRLAITVFCEPTGRGVGQIGGGLGVAEPSYSLYPVLAAIHDTAVVRVALGDAFELPGDFADQLNDAGCRLAMVVSPHAPSGRAVAADELAAVARRFRGVLLIDEAYVDFADGDALGLVRDGDGGRLDNVLILRSLSKGYSLAGLRFGYGIGHPGLIAALDKARDSYNTDAVSQAAATAALRHRELAAAGWNKVRAERGRLAGALVDRGWRVLPSDANFLLAQPGAARQGGTAAEIYESLKRRGVYVRYFDQDRLRDRLRITVGTAEQNDALLAALDASC
ncbi:MAG: aminotransferase class I/II-fold pyridoxal phosphate-dependent enzyme [Phycisphaeraceae bacterium]